MAFLPQIGVPIPIYEEGRLYVNLLCTGPDQEPKHVACPNLQATSAISIIFQLPDADDNAARDAIGMVTISVAITNGTFQIENGELARQEGGRAWFSVAATKHRA